MAGESLSDELCNASAQGKLSEVQRLLQNGAQVNGYNSFNRTALQVAKLGSTPVVEALLAAGANPNLQDPACGLTVLHDAAVTGFRCTVRALLDHGADANLVDEWGNLPLHLAAKEGHLEVIELLIHHTADPGAVNKDGLTAGQLARIDGREDAAALLVSDA
ncbi:cyclin-dependent kinase 4 inhibitor C [Salarias fasciatus]|uniref:cyclin-dependent kinase 4 inhibitor C n=1 Tax=Salarias fasciatus TaxID=181472 RepID=UPI001176C3CF|nr:cyclin-dependent kinase 4 inhibitor C [Salarias fasciatus]